MPASHSRIIKPTRREAILVGGATLGSFVGGPSFAGAAECLLTSWQIDGPYHITGAKDRRDVRSGKPGVDLALRMKLVDARTCDAIIGARAEIWSCDALGHYSGHPDVDPSVPPSRGGRPSGGRRGRGAGPAGPPQGGVPRSSGRRGGGGHREPTGPERFLRGTQPANDQGEVEFLTIYPGWYAPRAVHVHVKVHVGDNELLTTQLYFPEDLNATIHQTGEYASRYPSPYRNDSDLVMRMGLDGQDPVGVYPTMTAEGKVQVGTLTIGVNRA